MGEKELLLKAIEALRGIETNMYFENVIVTKTEDADGNHFAIELDYRV